MADDTTEKKTTSRNKKTGDDTTVPEHTTMIQGGDATIVAGSQDDRPRIARLLLEHADHPDQVRTTTAPRGWIVPEKIAKAAGLD